MTPESDGGIDKFKVLSAISGASAPQPAPPAPAPDRPPSATRRAIQPPPPWVRHRTEIAAIVTAFVGVIWLAVGLAQASWWPCFAGILFVAGALAIWVIEVWGVD